MKRMKMPTSEWVERSKNALAQGYPGTNSKRWTQYVEGVFPSHTSGHGTGPYLFDAWGTRYLDFICGLGAISLSYSNQGVIEAVERQVRKGASHSLPTTLEIELAEHISALVPSAERMRFLKNGDDASRAAIRIARTYTNKSLVLSDGYHGSSDIFTSLTQPALGIKDQFQIVPLELADLKDAACVIVEALKLSDGPEYQQWIRALRQKCKKNGVIFILDEIVTGMRVPKWCIANAWALDPDIILLGKGIANGYPISIVAGKKELMNCGEYFISTTFSGEAISQAACMATLEELAKRSFEDLMFYGKRIQEKLNALNPEIKFDGWGTRCMLNMTNPTTALFAQEMCKAGILLGKAHFFNFAHLEANIESFFLDTARSVVDQIKAGRVKMEGKMPVETFRR